MPSSENVEAFGAPPETLNELKIWIRERLRLTAEVESELIAAIDAVFTRHEKLWKESKQEAVQALAAGYAEQMARVSHEMHAKDATRAASRSTSSTSSPTSRNGRIATLRRS